MRGVTTKRQVVQVNQRIKAREAKLKKQPEVSSFTNSYIVYKRIYQFNASHLFYKIPIQLNDKFDKIWLIRF